MKLKKYIDYIWLSLILLTALILRSWKIESNFYYSGELGKELIYLKEFADKGTLPLIGMATSHEWLSYGPFYYWIMMPLFKLFNGDPMILIWTSITVSIISLGVGFFIISKIYNRNIALSATAIQAVSPLMIWQTRLGKLHVFFWLLMPLILLGLSEIWKGNKKWIFWTGILLGLTFSFHFSQIPFLLVAALVFRFKSKLFKSPDYLKFLAGLLIPNITLIAKDIKLLLWLPYRTVNPAGKELTETTWSLIEYFGKNLFWNDSYVWVGFIAVIFMFIVFILKKHIEFKKEFAVLFLISSIGVTTVANALHGSPPIHYFLSIFTFTPILIAYYFTRIKYWGLLIIVMLFFNIITFNSEPLFYKPFKGTVKGTDIVDYNTIRNVSSFIVADAKGMSLSIQRVGPYDHFPENYSQNYKYLIMLMGGNITKDSANVYTIVEDENGVHVKK